MKKYIAIFISLVTVLGLCACGNQKTTVSEKDKDNKKDIISEETVKMSEYDIIYNFDKIPDKFWTAFDYGYEEYKMDNRYVYNSRLEKELGAHYGKLTNPLTEYTQYTMIDGVCYEMLCNTGNWLYAKNLTPISDGSFSDRVDFYYTTTDLVLHWINMDLIEIGSLYSDHYPVTPDSAGYIGNINGWDCVELVEGNGDFGGYMYQKINDEFYLQLSMGRIKDLTDKQYEKFYTTLANSFTFKGVCDTETFEHVILPEKYTVMDLGEEVKLNLSNMYVSSWLVSEGYANYNLINFTNKDKTGIFKLVEYPGDLTLAQHTENSDYAYWEDYDWNGFPIRIQYAKGTSIGDTEIVGSGEFVGFAFEQDGTIYSVEYTSKEDITTMEQVKDFLGAIEFLEFKNSK